MTLMKNDIDTGNLNVTVEKQRLEIEYLQQKLSQIEQEEVRRIRHLNRLGTWAQQDPTGPLQVHGIQEWVLAELKAALGSAYEPTAWQPETSEHSQKEGELERQGTIPAEELRKIVESWKSSLEKNWTRLDPLNERFLVALESLIHRADSPKGPA